MHDPFDRHRAAEEHAAFVEARRSPRPTAVRLEIVTSWARSSESVDPTLLHAPIVPDAIDRWRDGPVAHALATVEAELSWIAADSDVVAAVTDADGTIVWTSGGRAMRRRAEQVGFLPGGRWDERSAGTNALALALRNDHPSTVRASEHFAPMVHDWVCYAAPIHEPGTATPVGVLDISTTWTHANPLALATATSLARNVDHALATVLTTSRSLLVNVLGRTEVWANGHPLVLPPRQVELLTLLTLAPGGLTLEQIHTQLHGDRPVALTTTKVELSHLRRVLGDLFVSRPYRLTGSWRADHRVVVEALRRGDVDQALDAYRGPLLARSDSPTITEHRHIIDSAVRAAVIVAPSAARLAQLRRGMPEDPFLAELAGGIERET